MRQSWHLWVLKQCNQHFQSFTKWYFWIRVLCLWLILLQNICIWCHNTSWSLKLDTFSFIKNRSALVGFSACINARHNMSRRIGVLSSLCWSMNLFQVNEALEVARTEVQRLHRERNLYEETMKKAFMRGVCALNLEAMTMFHDGDKGMYRKFC